MGSGCSAGVAARRVGRGAARPQGGTTPPGTPTRLVHGGPFEIVETDGNPVQEFARVLKDTVKVGPGEHYDVVWEAREPRQWLLHCHIPHHTTNGNTEQEGGGGLMMVINVTP